MIFLRQERGQALRVYEVCEETLNVHGTKSRRRSKAWLFIPKLGYEGDGSNSRLCGVGRASLANDMTAAIAALEKLYETES